ncbi:uncharacterized protein BCR38DRAFT_419481 [Pseudomassariella vexata]|uniref:WW domain-containing protein n=1 Tax=Pseudomassariella vexata TaxID=1141098 RepID=A0A1Y2EDT8_9PEZI|nr:uncharacterized protein BCR38DRAFT_419481 [Pseudomassariella vexata]ORY69577.1 hypothetical protein BCR38DRAFT_419481 [Pseudomassariella vexata]
MASQPSSPNPAVGEPAQTPLESKTQELAATSDTNTDAQNNRATESSSASNQESSVASPSNNSEESEESKESGEASPINPEAKTASAPPLPNEPPPPAEDDGWDFHWDATRQAYFFYNRFTQETTWENPRLRTTATSAVPAAAAPGTAEPPKEAPPAGGYNPAIHGDYDPNAWYAQGNQEETSEMIPTVDPAAAYAAIGSFNRFTGRWQGDDQNPDNHNDENKSRRQMNAFFDVDAAANSHDGRSLKAERSGKKPSKTELKQFKEKRRARKEEKRRAWLRD